MNTITNFIDSDEMENDNNFSYHINWFTGSGHNESHRASDAQDSTNKQNPIPEGCDAIDKSLTKIDNQITSVATASAGGRGAERVKNRTLNALEKRRLQIKQAFEKDDCGQQRLDEQALEFNTTLMSRFDEQYKKDSVREEDKSLMYVAVGVGVLVIGAVIIIGTSK